MYYDKQVVTMPYTRGTAILYYNKDLYANAGLNQAPTSLEELNEYAEENLRPIQTAKSKVLDIRSNLHIINITC